MEVFEILSCSEGNSCKNSLEQAGYGSAKCGICRYSPNSENVEASFWKPDKTGKKHPIAEQEKRDRGIERRETARLRRLSVDKSKRNVLVKAAKAEKLTEKNFIRATVNSGRANRDGDHTINDCITVDTKLQSTREEPVVHLNELEKVRSDAARAGNPIGCLLIRNKHGVGVVVLTESDFAKLTTRVG